MDEPTPSIAFRLAADGPTRAILLMLHGGGVDSHEPVKPNARSFWRVAVIARMLHRRLKRHGIDVVMVHYRYRGWNGDEMSPVVDARSAIAALVSENANIPIIAVGHSMGGRVACRIAGDSAVKGVVGLAPWLPNDEPVPDVGARAIRIIHGTGDSWTSARFSRRWARRAADAGADVSHIRIRFAGHFMLMRVVLWNHLTVCMTREVLRAAGVDAGTPRWNPLWRFGGVHRENMRRSATR